MSGSREQTRPGDWKCPKCSAVNYSRREQCYRCKVPKDSASNPSEPPSQLDYYSNAHAHSGAGQYKEPPIQYQEPHYKEPPIQFNEHVPYQEQMPYKDQMPYREQIPYQDQIPYREQIPYKDPIPYREQIPYKDQMHYQDPIPYRENVYPNLGGMYQQQESNYPGSKMPIQGGIPFPGIIQPTFQGEWVCIQCRALNHGQRSECFICGFSRWAQFPQRSLGRGGHFGPGSNIQKKTRKEGDWVCPQCQYVNYAFRKQCSKCQTSKEESKLICYKDEKGHVIKPREGDWKCPHCESYNYAFRKVCVKCQKEKGSE
ncbi:MAG: hypothetical protein EZS28_008084 [Streblomastix strix]|uniref:RanBP2-type domain-containing protein n=1 Tax=Streblomastix strix TaxID=222440 RepID=A0A5J4WNI3_9EUKA|nr:MAG: hypothetical protein EZS28_008084 [Streblomastix strix]